MGNFTEINGIVIIEDNEELNSAYSYMLKSKGMFNQVECFFNCEDALSFLNKNKPKVILIDLELPGMSGIDGIKRIRQLYNDIKIVVITVYEDSEHVFDALCSGANGYITKESDHIQLSNAIEEVLDGGAPMSRKIANMVVSSFGRNPHSPLTPRETEVIELLSEGKTYRGVAKSLSVSIDTVKTHIQHIYDKLQVNTKAEALEKARDQKLV